VHASAAGFVKISAVSSSELWRAGNAALCTDFFHNKADGKHESRQNKLNSMWNGQQMPSLIIMLIFLLFSEHISLFVALLSPT
jgi:hypothetical protein